MWRLGYASDNVLKMRKFVIHTLVHFIAGPREARNPSLDSDQPIAYYACAPQ